MEKTIKLPSENLEEKYFEYLNADGGIILKCTLKS